MWFKQISFYPLNKEKLPEADVLSDKLAELVIPANYKKDYL